MVENAARTVRLDAHAQARKRAPRQSRARREEEAARPRPDAHAYRELYSGRDLCLLYADEERSKREVRQKSNFEVASEIANEGSRSVSALL